MSEDDVLDRLFAVIEERKADRPTDSYTTSLLDHDDGQDAILEKIGEEATEVILAAKNEEADRLTAESADLVYHLLVLLAAHDLDLDDLRAALDERR